MASVASAEALRRWLREVGFSRGNPFATGEASRERDWLPESFVDGGEYDLIWGDPMEPQNALIFAPAGGGKTAYRVMIEQACCPADCRSAVLAAPYTSVESVLARLAAGQHIGSGDHLRQILASASAALLDSVIGSPERAEVLVAPGRGRLAWFCRNFAPVTLRPDTLWERVAGLAPEVQVPYRPFAAAAAERRLTRLLGDYRLLGQPAIALLGDLADDMGELTAPSTDLRSLLSDFVRLTRQARLAALYVLVDRLDELPATADDPGLIARLLEPLLADLVLMEMPGVAFKLFLPVSVFEPLRASRRLRFDRLRTYEIRWNEELLSLLLSRRLQAFSDDGLMQSLSQISAGGETFDQQLVRWANGSPRRLLRFGELLFQAHVGAARQGQPVPALLTAADMETARNRFLEEYLPLLQIDPTAPQVYLGRHVRELTPLEYKFLVALQRSGGWCDKEELIQKVWDTDQGVTDQAVSRLVRRIREKIEPNPGDPVYLLTEHNLGFRLKHLAAHAPSPGGQG